MGMSLTPGCAVKIAVVLGIASAVFLGIAWGTYKAVYTYGAKVALIAAVVCITPIVARLSVRRLGRYVEAVVAAVVMALVACAGGSWALGQLFPWRWALCVLLLAAVVEFGRACVNSHRERTLRRLRLGRFEEWARAFESNIEPVLSRQALAYGVVPSAVLLSGVFGAYRGLNIAEALNLTILSLLGLLVFAEVLVLIDVCRHMMLAVFNAEGKATRSIKPVVPDEDNGLDLACVTTELRKIYLLNAGHNAVILAVAASLAAAFSDSAPNTRTLIVLLLLVFGAGVQLPYVLGQSALHDRVLGSLDGVRREELKESLAKFSPLSPSWHILAALAASGTAGGVFFFLCEWLLTQTLTGKQ